MKTALKRIIVAVAVFGALSALCYSCSPLRASAFDPEGVPDEYNQELVEWCLDELNTTYQIYRTGPVPAAAIQKLQALVYASAVSLGKSVYSQYEPDFNNNLYAIITGFYFDSAGNIHVTDVFLDGDSPKQQKKFLVLASDEHWTTFSGLYDVGTNSVTGYGVRFNGSATAGALRLITFINNTPTYGYNVLVNDDGNTDQWFGDDSLEINVQRPAAVCNAFPPAEYGSFMGYLQVTDVNGNAVYLRDAPSVSEPLLQSDLESVVDSINTYITNNYPLSGVEVPLPQPVPTLPNDEYSGLPAGWNEINPVPMPDIETPSAPLTDAEIENAHDWLTDFSFWASVQSGLAFWFAAAAHAAEINETVTELLLGMSLLAVLGYVIWRWGI